MRALVIGGTGPTGHFIVNGLLARGRAGPAGVERVHQLHRVVAITGARVPLQVARTDEVHPHAARRQPVAQSQRARLVARVDVAPVGCH